MDPISSLFLFGTNSHSINSWETIRSDTVKVIGGIVLAILGAEACQGSNSGLSNVFKVIPAIAIIYWIVRRCLGIGGNYGHNYHQPDVVVIQSAPSFWSRAWNHVQWSNFWRHRGGTPVHVVNNGSAYYGSTHHAQGHHPTPNIFQQPVSNHQNHGNLHHRSELSNTKHFGPRNDGLHRMPSQTNRGHSPTPRLDVGGGRNGRGNLHSR